MAGPTGGDRLIGDIRRPSALALQSPCGRAFWCRIGRDRVKRRSKADRIGWRMTDPPFFQHPDGRFATAIDAMADGIARLRRLQTWPGWISIVAEGQGTAAGEIQPYQVRILRYQLDTGQPIAEFAVLRSAKVRSRTLFAQGPHLYNIDAATPMDVARILDAIFRRAVAPRLSLPSPPSPRRAHEMADMTQKMLFAASLAAALLAAAPARAADTVTTPASGSPGEAAILDVMRKPMESLFGKPIDFKVQTITVAKDYAYVLVHPQRPGGRTIETKAWAKVGPECEQAAEDVNIEALLHRVGGAWTFDLPSNGKPDVCASDTIVGEDVLKARGLPLQMIISD
eukprot:gene19045-19394_t